VIATSQPTIAQAIVESSRAVKDKAKKAGVEGDAGGTAAATKLTACELRLQKGRLHYGTHTRLASWRACTSAIKVTLSACKGPGHAC
jgi:hypothetical protein